LAQALAAGDVVTDEAAAVERVGGRPRVVAGHADNIKITVDEDMALAELFMKRQQQG
jgi:2-C-methyl-D-erythritol 4-phosphate cytidylyltransferase